MDPPPPCHATVTFPPKYTTPPSVTSRFSSIFVHPPPRNLTKMFNLSHKTFTETRYLHICSSCSCFLFAFRTSKRAYMLTKKFLCVTSRFIALTPLPPYFSVTHRHAISEPPPPPLRDVIYGWPLRPA